MTTRKFHKTIIRLEILSEGPVDENMTPAQLYEETIDGHYSGRALTSKVTVLNGAQAARALQLQGSDPGFFQLDDKGEDAD